MLVLAPLILIAVSALGAAASYFAARPIYGRDLILITVMSVIAVEVSLLTIRAGRGQDQGGASQAGLGGMVLLMLAMVGLLAAGRFIGIVSSAAVTQWSPLLFVAALAVVATAAIRTIRQAPAKLPSAGSSEGKGEMGSEHV